MCHLLPLPFLLWPPALPLAPSAPPPPPAPPPPALFSLLQPSFSCSPSGVRNWCMTRLFFFFFLFLRLEACPGPSLYSVFNCISQYLVQEIPGIWLVLWIKIQNTWVSIWVLLLYHLKFNSITIGKRPDAFCKSTLGYHLEERFLFWKYHHLYSYTILLFLFGLML